MKGLNIQGNSKTARSKNGRYVIIKTGPFSCALLVDNQPPQEYHDTHGRTIQSIAVSDTGLIAISLDSIGSSIVRLFNGGLNVIFLVYDEPWQLRFGTGLSLTPKGDMLAIGSPGESKVYTYDLDTAGSILKYTKKLIVGPNFEGFGWKVGLSEGGNSLAIASPSSNVDSLDVGAINVYALVEGTWESLDTVLYGTEDSLRIGIGGVAIDDQHGIVSVQDNNLDHKKTFMVRVSYEWYSQLHFFWMLSNLLSLLTAGSVALNLRRSASPGCR